MHSRFLFFEGLFAQLDVLDETNGKWYWWLFACELLSNVAGLAVAPSCVTFSFEDFMTN